MHSIAICALIITAGQVELTTRFDTGRTYDRFMWVSGRLHLWAVGTPAEDSPDLILGDEGLTELSGLLD